MKRIIITILILGILLVSCAREEPTKPKPTGPDTELSSQNLKKFNSVNEIKELLKKSQQGASYYSYGGGARTFAATMAESSDMAMVKSAEAPQAAGEFSTTNIQVEGVDEADFVKNDNKYIYIISGDKLVIVDAFPADNAKILSKTKIKGNPTNLFINDDRLVVFTNDYEEVYRFSEFDFMPRPRSASVTHALLFDISDKKDPELIKDYNLHGYYFQSRMIGDYVYFIVKDNVYYYNEFVDVPVLKESSKVVMRPDIYYFDNPEYNYVFHTIAAFNINGEELEAKSFMMGYSDNLYVSQNNIYIAYQKNLPYVYYQTHNEERFYKVVVPLLPSDARNKINSIKENGQLNSYEKWNQIETVLEEMYNNMDESEIKQLVKEIENAVKEYEARLEAERSKTVIHKINIENGNIDYDSKGEVNGRLLNQFSMDEYGTYFRVATTTDIWSRRDGNVVYNNVFVLDDDMEVVGKLENVARGERIYSTRFIGDRLYMVTFKRIDPLFVIDLADPTDPKILCELKIPGYSDYLHPYDKDHIIGIGKETDSNEWGGVSVKGIKLALFDVSDVENPKLVDKFEIGESGTDSEALRDHKAFLFDKNKGILVIPVTEIGKGYYDERYGYYRQKSWNGAYVFEISDSGFEKRGKVTHVERDGYDYWQYAVKRSLYMDDVLYTVSGTIIKMNDLDDLEEINEIELPHERYPEPVPMTEVGVVRSDVGVVAE